LQENTIFFVIRQTSNAVYQVLERHKINRQQALTSGQIIRLTGTKGAQCLHLLRRLGYRDPETGHHYVFLTNNFKLVAKTIADIYKERRQTAHIVNILIFDCPILLLDKDIA